MRHPLLESVRSGKRPGLLLLDYDGTLAPFRAQRDEAAPYPGVREALERLPVNGPGRFVLVSGRDAKDLARLLRLRETPEIWGCHGGQRLLPAGGLSVRSLDPEQEAFLRAAGEMLSIRIPGALERKACSLALHARAAGDSGGAMLAEAKRVWRTPAAAAGFAVHDFDGGVELRLPGIDKGEAVRVLSAENPGSVIVYLGDDKTDEDAFNALGESGLGILVRARRRKTAASWRLRPPEELLLFLDAWRHIAANSITIAESDGNRDWHTTSIHLNEKDTLMTDTAPKKLIVVSNRLPIAISQDEAGNSIVSQGTGGLVTALAPVLQNRGGLWIGWPGDADKRIDALLKDFSKKAGYVLRPVHLTKQEIKDFYQGFANEIIWPLFHEFQLPSNYLPSYWEAFQTANRKFAEAAVASSQPDDFIWVHDYHLMLQASQLKQMGQERRTGFFLHIPFPPADIFLKLPWRKEIVDAILDFDLIGFQTIRDRSNFYDVVKRLYPDAAKRGRGAVATLTAGENKTRIGAFPISIDVRSFAKTAASPEVRERGKEIRAAFGDKFLLFSADRLDYTKGIPQRLNALSEALTMYPELHEKICMIQILVPSRQEVPQYQALKMEIEHMVGELNGKFATAGWTPVQYMYRSLNRVELVSYYTTADMAMVTPLRDGMNLVAKEYCACNLSARGVLCLSEFAGAAMELHRYALMVNPFDIVGVAKAIRQAVDMPLSVRQHKMRSIRALLRRRDIFFWVDSFLMTAFAKHLSDFPIEYMDGLSWETLQGPPWNDAE